MSHRRESHLKQLTVRGFGADIEEAIRRIARSEHVSLNEAVVRLLRKGAGLGADKASRDVVGDSLDHLAGTWSEKERLEFEAAIQPMERIDTTFWGTGSRARPRRRSGS